MKMIKDPRVGIPGISCMVDNSYIQENSIKPLFNSDPFELHRTLPKIPETITIEDYIIATDSSWILNGFKLLYNPDVGVIADRCYTDNASPKQMLMVEPDTSIILQDDNKFVLATNNIKSIKHLPGEVGLAVSAEISNWGSFLTRIVPKLIALKEMQIDKVLVYLPHNNFYEMVKLIGWSDD